MRNNTFQNANKVFKGQLRLNKQAGLDVSKPKAAITKGDLEKLYNEYFVPGLARSNVKVLQEKVFFDLIYHTGHRGKEGLWALTKSSFQLKETPEGLEYIEPTCNEVTKRNQGDKPGTATAKLHEHPIILQQDDGLRCPVNSFKHYCNLLNEKVSDFFQRVNKKKDGFDAVPIGKNTLGTMMKTISKAANLSWIYTNHEIRSTTATALHKSDVDLKRIQHVTKHKNIQSLENYVSGPTLEDKVEYSNKLFAYANKTKKRQAPLDDTTNDQPSEKMQEMSENAQPVFTKPAKEIAIVTQNKENEEEPGTSIATNIVQNTQNQLKQAPVMFPGATFSNCNITLNIPKWRKRCEKNTN